MQLIEPKSNKQEKLKAKFFKFHENRRPAFFGTWRKKSQNLGPRKPFAQDKVKIIRICQIRMYFN